MLTIMNIEGHIPAERIDTIRHETESAAGEIIIRRKTPADGLMRSPELFTRAVAIYDRARSRRAVRSSAII